MAEAARRIDRIDAAARFTAQEARALNARFADAAARDVLEAVILGGVAGRSALVSSFGAESAVLLHLAAEVDPSVPILFLDTGKHFDETLAYRDALIARLGLANVISLAPDTARLAERDESGLRWSYDPDGCCEIRKVAPLADALRDFDSSITGRKAFQSATRADLPVFEIDDADALGRLKVNPLIGWSREDIERYLVDRDLPRHPLIEDGFLSIGCSPCTSKVADGEDPRAGRWRGWEKTECGIHNAPETRDVPPGFDPVF